MQNKEDERVELLFRQSLLSPTQVQKMERDSRRVEQRAYRESLDQMLQDRSKSHSEFNRREDLPAPTLFDPILNPIPSTVRNPYILKSMSSKLALSGNSITHKR